MDEDDSPKPRGDALAAVEREDLSTLGVEGLQDRIARLEGEKARTEQALAARQSSRAAAEALFSGKG
ncbi:DUF1192 family protein [Yunchengibacter salinarum]|uniref:DUF1192 family protein n=1 Tax=Yunchengibacter salinarum TaxID=3133399 RepID=UPI0035B6499A